MRTTISNRHIGATCSRMAILAAAGAMFMPIAQSGAAIAQEEEAKSSPMAIDTIVVTARRREENVQDVPISVTALTANALERQQIFETVDLDRVTPNLQFTSYGPLSGNNSAAQVFIRGIGQTDPTGAVDPGVGIYIDDVYMGRSVGGAMDFRDIAGVTILRGPQGTLFGRNTIGGAVQLTTVTPNPGDPVSGTARVRVGTDDLREVFGAVTLPVSDTLATRIAGGMRKRDGYVVREYDGIDLGDDDSWSINASARWVPQDNFSLTLRADYASEDENGSPFVFETINTTAAFVAAASMGAGCAGATFPPPYVPSDVDDPACGNDFQNKGPYTNGGTAPVYSTTENWGVSAVAEWDVSDAITLKSISSYRKLDWTGARDADNTPLRILHTQYDSTSKQFSQELQALYSSDRLNGVVGVYYFDEQTDDEVRVDYAAPPAVVAAGGIGARDLQYVDLTTESYAAFTEWTYDVSEQFSVSGGIRYTDETKGMDITANAIFPATLDDPTDLEANSLINPGLHETSFSAVTTAFKAQYRWSDSFMTYASYSEGFKSGGYNQRYNAAPPNNEPISFAEERATSYEVGFKADLTGTLRLNGSVFSTQYKDMQLIYRLGIVPLLFNAGDARINGFELEFTYTPTNNLLIEGGVGYLDDKIKEIVEVEGTTATVGPDNSLPFTPDWQLNLGASYVINIGDSLELTPRVDLSYTDDMYYDAANSEEVIQNAYTLINTSLQLANPEMGWRLVFGVNNLTDKIYRVAGNSSYSTASGYAESIYARDRNWFLTLSYDF